MGNGFISEEDMAAFFGLSLSGLRAQRYRGQGPAYHKVGKRVLYLEKDVEAFVSDTKVDPKKAGKRA